MHGLRRWCCLALLSIACGTSDGDDDPTDAGSTTDATASTTAPTSTIDPTTTASSTETMSTSDSTTASTTTASTTTADTEDESTTKSDDSSGTSDTDSATPCGDGVCGGDEVCVLPCCGGPAPGCEDSDENGECPNGGEPTPADQCGSGCNTTLCCPMAPCMADPPFCAGKAELQCHETQCSLDSCFGSLQGGELYCECA